MGGEGRVAIQDGREGGKERLTGSLKRVLSMVLSMPRGQPSGPCFVLCRSVFASMWLIARGTNGRIFFH